MTSKQKIRSLMRCRAAEEAAAGFDSRTASDAVWRQLEGMDAFREAHCILSYMSIEGEVLTVPYMDELLLRRRDTIFAIPLVCGDRLELRKYSAEKLQEGYLGIPEPSPDAEKVAPEEVDFGIVPGVAFDRCGGRLGHGKGFYDRLLPSLDCPVAGICFSWRLLDEPLPSDPWDRKADFIITEKKFTPETR